MELLTDKVIYHVETQEDYNDLMERLKELGCRWLDYEIITHVNIWNIHRECTCIYVKRKVMNYSYKRYFEKYYSNTKIIKYKKEHSMKVKLKADQKFIADWYEDCKGCLEYAIYNVHSVINESTEEYIDNDELLTWFNHDKKNKPLETLFKMHLFGYEIEQEPLYRVLIPNPNLDESGNKFILEKREKGVILAKRRNKNIYLFEDNQKLTEAEIKKDFAWAWQFAKEVE